MRLSEIHTLTTAEQEDIKDKKKVNHGRDSVLLAEGYQGRMNNCYKNWHDEDSTRQACAPVGTGYWVQMPQDVASTCKL